MMTTMEIAKQVQSQIPIKATLLDPTAKRHRVTMVFISMNETAVQLKTQFSMAIRYTIPGRLNFRVDNGLGEKAEPNEKTFE